MQPANKPTNSGDPAGLRVLLAHRYFWPDNVSLFPAMLKAIAEWHSEAGHRTTVFAPRVSEPAAQDRRREWAEERGVCLKECRLRGDRGRGVVGRAVNTVWYAWCLLWTLLRGGHDIVLVSTYPPVVAALVCRFAKLFRRFEYVYYVQDIYPEMLARRSGRVARAVGALLRPVDAGNVASSGRTVTLSESMRDTLLARGADPSRIAVVPNYAIDRPPSRPRGERNAAPKLVFAGNTGKAQNLLHFLEAARVAASRCDFQIEILGRGDDLDRLKGFVREHGMANVHFGGFVGRSEAQRRIEQADAGVVAAAPGLYEVAHPSKTNSYLLAGLPLLLFAEPESAVAGWLVEHGFGVAASPVCPEQAAAAVESLVLKLGEGAFDRGRIARVAAELLSEESYLAEYGRLYEGAVSSSFPSRLRPAA